MASSTSQTCRSSQGLLDVDRHRSITILNQQIPVSRAKNIGCLVPRISLLPDFSENNPTLIPRVLRH